MSQTATAEAPPVMTKDGYVSVQVFHEMMMHKEPSEYVAEFSFEPYLNAMKKRSNSQCPIAGGLLKEMKSRLDMLPSAEEILANPDILKGVAPLLFPTLFIDGQMGLISVPFSDNFLFITPDFKELLESPDWEIQVSNLTEQAEARHGALDAGGIVLERFYDKKIDLNFSELLRLRHKKTGLRKFFKINIITDYLEVTPLKPLKKLSQKQIHQLLNEWDNPTFWKKLIPPKDFAFRGIVAGQIVDVTDREILSLMEKNMGQEDGDIDFDERLLEIQGLVRSLLGMPEAVFGSIYVLKALWQDSTTWSLIRRFDRELHYPSFDNPKGPYGRVIVDKTPIIISDLNKEEHLGPLEEELKNQGLRSLLLAPIFQPDGVIGGIMELASPEPFRFDQMTMMKLQEFVDTYTIGMNKFVDAIDNQVRLTIQQQFTSIHPSVEWKFKEAATEFYWTRNSSKEQPSIQPIVFRDIYPIYGQADIVSSSKLRNKFIQADLIDNLKLVNEVMEKCREHVRFHLLDVFLKKTRGCLSRLQAGEYISSDETEIVGLLSREIHPLLHQLKEHYTQIPTSVFDNYFDQLDEDLDIIYRQRKDYEESVSMLNEAVGSYLEKEDEKMQEVLPHYFEKYQTDGVEYNIYVGQALLEKQGFSPFFLKDFRLWQLLHMCGITRLVEQKAMEMKVPLTTAQLIFVYNNSLSIRFRMDEKQFDVDGAYNVRYEILKKRIDKAVIKGTNERLTVSGKIAIVYLSDKDKQEYLEYLHYLASEGHITEDIEDLQLERLQGADGLRALRVTVI